MSVGGSGRNGLRVATLVSAQPRIPALFNFLDTAAGVVVTFRSRQLHATYSGKFGGAGIVIKSKNGRKVEGQIPPTPILPFPDDASRYFVTYSSNPMPVRLEDVSEVTLTVAPIRGVGERIVGTRTDTAETTITFVVSNDGQ